MNTYIYALSDPEWGDVRYIGRSVRPAERLKSHMAGRGDRWGENPAKDQWLRDVVDVRGLVPILTVLQIVPETAPRLPHAYLPEDQAEMNWIARYREMGALLTNISPGGSAPGESTLRKLRERHWMLTNQANALA